MQSARAAAIAGLASKAKTAKKGSKKRTTNLFSKLGCGRHFPRSCSGGLGVNDLTIFLCEGFRPLIQHRPP